MYTNFCKLLWNRHSNKKSQNIISFGEYLHANKTVLSRFPNILNMEVATEKPGKI